MSQPVTDLIFFCSFGSEANFSNARGTGCEPTIAESLLRLRTRLCAPSSSCVIAQLETAGLS